MVGAAKMNEEFDHPSMNMLEFSGCQLASRAIAVALAEMVIKDFYGEEEFEAQQPLSVSETPDRWIIEGSRPYDLEAPRSHHQLVDGKVTIEILKRNCRIVKLIRTAAFAPDAFYGDEP